MKAWVKKEKKDEKLFNGKRTRGSGNQWSSKGDIQSEIFLIEDKSTDKHSFSVTAKLWEKIWEEAIQDGRIPLLSIQLNKDNKNLIVVDQRDFLELIKGGKTI